MKNHVAIIIVISLLNIFSCRRAEKPEAYYSNEYIAEKYLSGHSSEYLSIKDGFVLRFNGVYAFDRGGRTIEGVSISPKVEGQWTWESNSVLTFTPATTFDYGKTYRVMLNLPELLEDSSIKDDKLEWTFKTRNLILEMQLEGFKIRNVGAKDKLDYLGTIKSSDYIPSETAEAMVRISHEGVNMPLEWSHTGNGKVHSYVVSDIDRKVGEESKMLISWDGNKLDKQFVGNEEILVYPREKFVLNDIKISAGKERMITLVFTGPLSTKQDLRGLLTIDSSSDNLKWQIENNLLYIYPQSNIEEEFKLQISDKIESIDGTPLGKVTESKLRFQLIKPAIKLLGKGTIVPNSNEAIFSFETMNLRAVDVEICKIFEDNMLQFLQSNNLNSDHALNQVGRVIHKERILLSERVEGSTIKKNKWTRVGLDIKDYVKSDPKAVYQVRIGYRKEYAITDCEDAPQEMAELKLEKSYTGSIMKYPRAYNNDYNNRDNPCSKAYYHPGRFFKRNVLYSDIGVIAKKGKENQYTFVLSSISNGSPLYGAQIELYDYQQQQIVSSSSSRDGLALVKPERRAAFAVISFDNQYTYLKLDDQNSNSLSAFEIGGNNYKEIEGFIYADRGVHRPGDTIHLNFILEDRSNQLPIKHPVVIEVKDSKGNQKYKQTFFTNEDHVYCFHISTSQQDLTGQWQAKIKVGTSHFSKPLRIETIKPNRLRIALEGISEELNYASKNDRQIKFSSSWLHGAPANKLKIKIDAKLDNTTPENKKSSFVYMDPARKGSAGVINLYEGQLNEQGHGTTELELDPNQFPGKITAQVKTRVFEPSGNFSENYASLKISPFTHYVGVKCPESRWGGNFVNLGEVNRFKIKSIDQDGKQVGNRKLTVYIYNINWRWWYYEGERYNIYNLNSNEGKEAFYTKKLTTKSDGNYDLDIDFQDVDGGRKLIRICDDESGHCTGDFFYASAWWYEDQVQDEEQRKSMTKLNFSSNQEKYEVGKEVKLTIPSERGSKILISLESDNKVILQDWIEGNEESTTYAFRATKEMTPNIYAHVTMVQSYDLKKNDLPIRLYGVLPIMIEDLQTRLKPKIEAPAKIEPKSNFTLKVSEETGRPMTYTIAIVDEGLLDLTNFNTPAPHKQFYRKRSLGVKTWDIYGHVLTGVSSQVDKMITVGGDGDLSPDGANKKAIRFKPVVLTAGPLKLKAGEEQIIHFKMPSYLGSVRAMLIARENKAYGHTESTIPVKKPLMILPTLPRVVGPGEEIIIPVSVFAQEDQIKSADVSIKSSKHLTIIGESTQKVHFDQPGEELIYFQAKVGDHLGIAKVNISGNSGSQHIDQKVELDVRNPNQPQSRVFDKVIEPGSKWDIPLELVGMNGTNEGFVELSSFPQLNLEDRLDYLIRYPYGCIEQTTSGAFPQLYLEDIAKLEQDRKKKIEKYIHAAIRRIARMQLSSGGFSYWPGNKRVSSWGSTYAGHFLWECQLKGYQIPNEMIERWRDFQSSRAKSFKINRSKKRYYQRAQMRDQAYRLYTLSLIGEPALSAMNVLKNEVDLPQVARFMLAAAYADAGKKNVALDLIRNTKAEVEPYVELSFTYGSDLRDHALIAQTLMSLDRKDEAGLIIKEIGKKLNTQRWYSTQTVAQALVAAGKYLGDFKRNEMNATLTIGEANSETIIQSNPIYLKKFNPDEIRKLNSIVVNNSEDVLFARITMIGQKPPEETLEQKAINKNISLEVRYEDLKGKAINPDQLKRGTDFVAHVIVKNQNSQGTTLEELALSQIFPSGWEIQSGGLSNVSDALKDDSYDYRDVRDDRVYTFFDLGKRKDFRILLTATYEGHYILPAITCEAMYDREIYARTKAQRVKVVKP